MAESDTLNLIVSTGVGCGFGQILVPRCFFGCSKCIIEKNLLTKRPDSIGIRPFSENALLEPYRAYPLNLHFAMNTEQGAFFAMELLVLPRKNFSKPLLALLPTTIRSAEVLAAKAHTLSGAYPSNISNFPST
ncbi:hypothetical protein SAMN05878482_102651 [Peribacillus simplex]|uniref:Uncharacterized protein n=1 Tax=Peribacillus simplex TaxID=1478 RepID=A0A9X8WK27_9BACI|nr:hypothetical protein SAMN05878482_102651 [Peribacillus simplex]